MSKKKDCAQTTNIDEIIKEKVKEAVEKITPKTNLTKENLPSFFEDLHNLLWNRAGLNPEKALENMIFFFAYRLIELQADNLKLPQECRWSYITSIESEEQLHKTIKEGIKFFFNKPNTKPFFAPHSIQKSSLVYEIVHQINRISLDILQDTDTLGDIFEYMIGRGMSTMSDEGQYFTNRRICKLAFKLAFDIKKSLCRPDGSLCTFADWFCGTGGFPAEYVKGVKENLKSVEWNTACDSIYCQDMSVSSITTTLLNLLILTGTPFSNNQIRSSNSFYDPIIRGNFAPFSGLSIDYCFMNPPYGGDKTKGKDYKFKMVKKVKDESGKPKKIFLVNEDIQSIGIEDDDKVSAGVQLAMATLSDNGGVCCIVLPQGFFFGASKKSEELRKKLSEEYKIHFVVDISSGSFANTLTKTSMLVFQKGVGPTDKISFIDLEQNELVCASLEELRGKKYSLNYKQYLPQEVVQMEGFEMVKLGDIVKPVSMKHHRTIDGKENGGYPLVSSALKVNFFMDTFSCDIPSIIFNTTNADGNCAVHFFQKFNTTADTYTLTTDNMVTTKYLYYYLFSKPQMLKDCFAGTAHKHLQSKILLDLQIPLPSLEQQEYIVEAIDGWAQLANQEEKSLALLERQVRLRIKEMSWGQERVKLGDILIPIKGQKFNVSDGADEGKYPLLRSSADGKVKWMDTYTFEGPFITAGNGGEANFSLSEKFNASTHTLIYDTKDEFNKTFVYHSIQIMRPKISDLCFNGTALKNLNVGMFMDFEIPFPPLPEQQKLQDDFDEIRHKRMKIAEYKSKADEAVNRLIPK
jgi:type I restriction-modification system DNA methylase subunit